MSLTETVAMKDTDMSLTARASVASDFTDPVEWGLANAAGAGIGRVAMMHADRRFRKSGRVPLPFTSGTSVAVCPVFSAALRAGHDFGWRSGTDVDATRPLL